MKVIKIDGAQNKHVEYLFNKANKLMVQNKCGGTFYSGKDKIEINPYCEKVATVIRQALHDLKVKFTEE